MGLGVRRGDAAEGIEGEGPVYFIGDTHAVVFRFEEVAMAPEGEGAVGSGVDEFVRRPDQSDFRHP